MTPQHAHSSGGGSAGRAIVLVALAVAVGAFLLARGFDGADDGTVTSSGTPSSDSADGDNGDGEDGESNEDGSTTSTTSTTTSTTTTAPRADPRPPKDVKVAVMNGTGEPGRAARTTDNLNIAGYVTAAKNTEQDRVQESVIYYRQDYGDDAKAVASILGAPPDIIRTAPDQIMTLIKNSHTPQGLEDFHVFAVVGTDDVIPDPSPTAN